MMSLVDVWIKAAVERRVLLIDYFDKKEKKEYVNVEVEPHYIDFLEEDTRKGLFGVLRNQGTIIFDPNSVLKFTVTDDTFVPISHTREKQILNLYYKKELKYRKMI
jgi:hypothetical protein